MIKANELEYNTQMYVDFMSKYTGGPSSLCMLPRCSNCIPPWPVACCTTVEEPQPARNYTGGPGFCGCTESCGPPLAACVGILISVLP